MFNIIDPLIKLQQADKQRLLFVKVISEFISCLHWKVKIERETCYDLNLEEQKGGTGSNIFLKMGLTKTAALRSSEQRCSDEVTDTDGGQRLNDSSAVLSSVRL